MPDAWYSDQWTWIQSTVIIIIIIIVCQLFISYSILAVPIFSVHLYQTLSFPLSLVCNFSRFSPVIPGASFWMQWSCYTILCMQMKWRSLFVVLIQFGLITTFLCSLICKVKKRSFILSASFCLKYCFMSMIFLLSICCMEMHPNTIKKTKYTVYFKIQ